MLMLIEICEVNALIQSFFSISNTFASPSIWWLIRGQSFSSLKNETLENLRKNRAARVISLGHEYQAKNNGCVLLIWLL